MVLLIVGVWLFLVAVILLFIHGAQGPRGYPSGNTPADKIVAPPEALRRVK